MSNHNAEDISQPGPLDDTGITARIEEIRALADPELRPGRHDKGYPGIGVDIHDQVAAAMFNVKSDDVTPEMREKARTIAKAQLFSAPYGAFQGDSEGNASIGGERIAPPRSEKQEKSPIQRWIEDTLTGLQAIPNGKDFIGANNRDLGNLASRKDVKMFVMSREVQFAQAVWQYIVEALAKEAVALQEARQETKDLRNELDGALKIQKALNRSIEERLRVLEHRWYERLHFALWEFVSQLFEAKFASIDRKALAHVPCALCPHDVSEHDGQDPGACFHEGCGCTGYMSQRSLDYINAERRKFNQPELRVDKLTHRVTNWEEKSHAPIFMKEGDERVVTIDCQHCSELFKQAFSDDEQALEGTVGEETLDHLHATGHFPQCPSYTGNTPANPLCKACAIGSIFMNDAPLYPGYKPGDPSPPELCAAHNAKGHHHILWNGSENEMVECGSARCNEIVECEEFLAKRRVPPNPPYKDGDVGGGHAGLDAVDGDDL